MKKIISLLVIVASLQVVTHGFELTFDSFSQGDPIRNKFSMVHFTLPSVAVNDFQGGFFWLPTKQLLPATTVTYNGVTKNCSKQVRGLYYTNAKGSRLWPLDQQSLNGLKLLSNDYNNLQVNGGLYTTCGTSGSADLYSIYGQITYYDTSTSTDLGSLSAGLMYDIPNNAVDTTLGLFPTIQYFNNQTPLGYIYDNVGGIGFVGGPLSVVAHNNILDLIKNFPSRNINNIFGFVPGSQNIQAVTSGGTFVLGGGISAGLDTIWNISVLGNVLLSRGGLDVADRQSVLGNPSRSSSVVFSDVVNTSDILNTLRKSSDAACRGQTKITAGGSVGGLVVGSPKTVCVYNDRGGDTFDVGYGSDTPFVIDLANTSEYNGVEFIVKGRNVVLVGSVPGKQYSINLFVDNGNVLLKNGDFSTEVVNGGQYSTNYGVFNAKGDMINDYDTIAPIIDYQYDATPGAIVYPYPQTYMSVTRDSNAYPIVSPKFIYDAINTFSGAGNSEAIGVLGYGVYLRGNIFINGLLLGRGAGNVPSGLTNKYYIHGRLSSLNTALEPSQKRVDLINTIFGNTYVTSMTPILTDYINFNTIFSWQCLLNGYAADANGTQTAQPCKTNNDTFKFNPLVLINTGVPSRLLP